jgi:hypothetical protein
MDGNNTHQIILTQGQIHSNNPYGSTRGTRQANEEHFVILHSQVVLAVLVSYQAKMKLVDNATNQFLPGLCQMHSNNPHGFYREHKVDEACSVTFLLTILVHLQVVLAVLVSH